MLDAVGLIKKHRTKGVLINANLLVLYLVGSTNKNRIPTFKRTQVYTIEDFELLQGLIAYLGDVITTPHVLTEVSNLANLHEPELKLSTTRPDRCSHRLDIPPQPSRSDRRSDT